MLEQSYIEAKNIIAEYESRMKSTWFDPKKDLPIGTKVRRNGYDDVLYIVEKNGNDVLVSNKPSIEDDDYDDLWVGIYELRPVLDGHFEFTTMYDLATNFERLMFHGEVIPQDPKAEYWMVANDNNCYWEIGDVQCDGTYLCYGDPDRYIDQNRIVAIKYKN